MNQRIVLYTCIIGGYDDLLEPSFIDPSLEFVCISDRPPPQGSVWRYVPVKTYFGDKAAINRYVKMHPHDYFHDADISIYIDGNIRIVSSPAALAQDAMSHAPIALYQHFSRNCIYAEAEECAAVGHAWFWRIYAQMNRYRRDRYLAGNGLYEGNIIIRQHNRPEIIRLMDLWWAEYHHGVRRDQLSLPYLIWKTSTVVQNLGVSDQRYGRAVFSLDSIHGGHSLLTRIRGMINRRILTLCPIRR